MPFLEPSALVLSAPVEPMPPYIAAWAEMIRSRGLSMQRQTALYDQGWGIERRVACIKDLQRCARYYAKQDLETYVGNPEIVSLKSCAQRTGMPEDPTERNWAIQIQLGL